MSKKKKRSAPVYSPESIGAVKKRLRAFNWKRLLTLALSTIAAFAVFEAVLAVEEQNGLEFSIIMPIYYIIVTLLIIVVIFLNRGFSTKEFTRDMLREDIPDDEAERICAMINRHKRLAKKLMLILVPFVLTILLDIVYLFYGNMLAGIVNFFVPN